MIFMKFP